MEKMEENQDKMMKNMKDLIITEIADLKKEMEEIKK